MTLQELKDNYAQGQGYLNWISLEFQCCVEGAGDFDIHLTNLIILAQQEALKNASESARIEKNSSRTGEIEYVDGLGGNGIVYTIHRRSITNENNLIK